MRTHDAAGSISDLVEYYCGRCSVGMYNCKISAMECLKIKGDVEFEKVTRAEAIAKPTRKKGAKDE